MTIVYAQPARAYCVIISCKVKVVRKPIFMLDVNIPILVNIFPGVFHATDSSPPVKPFFQNQTFRLTWAFAYSRSFYF